jgi:hypothetical protein
MEQQGLNPNQVPIGPGGTPGRIFRIVTMFLTAGFAYPRACIEGLDCTAIQRETMGNLYDKKKK